MKGRIGHRAWRVLVRPVIAVLSAFPPDLLYAIGLRLRRRSFPYRMISEGDTVVQIGAPRDLLRAGRSRAIYFALLVGMKGRLVVFEPESTSVGELQAFLKRMELSDRTTVVPKGCWLAEGQLEFFVNPQHPASNLVGDASTLTAAELLHRGYRKAVVPVTTVDHVLQTLQLAAPKLISITTNGSEEQILQGAANTLRTTGVYIAIADTGPSLSSVMASYGYRLIARDDRGFTFERLSSK